MNINEALKCTRVTEDMGTNVTGIRLCHVCHVLPVRGQ